MAGELKITERMLAEMLRKITPEEIAHCQYLEGVACICGRVKSEEYTFCSSCQTELEMIAPVLARDLEEIIEMGKHLETFNQVLPILGIWKE